MQLIWNLDELFINNDAFYNEIDNIKVLLTNFNQYKNIIFDEQSLLNALNDYWSIKEKTNNILIYGSLKYYQNVNDAETIKMKADAEAFNNEVNASLKFMDNQIISIGKKAINEYISINPKLEVYSYYLDNLFRMQEHISEQHKDEILTNLNSINQELSSYNELITNIDYGTINIDGKEETIKASNYNKYLASKNRDIRRDVYLTTNQQFQKESDKFARILNNIYTYRNQNSKLEEYDTVLAKVLHEENINPQIIDKLITTVNNNCYLLQDYLKIKPANLNINDPHLYDYNVSLADDLNIEYSIEEAITIIKNALKPLGKDYLDAIDYLLEGHIDAIPNESKHQTITFSWNTYSFMNYRGKYNDLKNMVHELGHIVNYYYSKKNLPYLYEDSSIFVGETASIVNEILLNKYLINNANNDQEKIFYLSKSIENYITSVFKQTMYTEYEQILYNVKTLTPELLSTEYQKLLKQYYGDNPIYDDECNIEWTRLGHLYRWSYYPYKYATGLIMASIVANNILNHTLSNTDYIKFLSLGNSMYSLDLLKTINIDLLDSHVIEDGFKVLEDNINELKHILKSSN